MGKPQSERIRKLNVQCRLALTALTDSEFPSIRTASQHYNIPFETLRPRVHGGQTHAESREELQLLTSAEEKVLADLITRLAASGHPLSHTQV